MKIIAAIALLMLLTGCGPIAKLNTASDPQIARAVDSYCVLPQIMRAPKRAAVNALTTVGTIEITCPGDVE